MEALELVDEHVACFNAGVTSGARAPMLELFTDEIAGIGSPASSSRSTPPEPVGPGVSRALWP